MTCCSIVLRAPALRPPPKASAAGGSSCASVSPAKGGMKEGKNHCEMFRSENSSNTYFPLLRF
jgi:hypothetical protein